MTITLPQQVVAKKNSLIFFARRLCGLKQSGVRVPSIYTFVKAMTLCNQGL
jgi:hypothetical protein